MTLRRRPLVDVRSPEEFSGEKLAPDHLPHEQPCVGGHVPGAKKHPVEQGDQGRRHVELGDAHVIRNAGGVVSEDVVRSLVISQRLLGTEEIILIHHTVCGMLTFEDDAVKSQIVADVGARPHFALEAFADVEDDVRQSIVRLRANPFIEHKDRIRGFALTPEG